ncbi:MAG TPA: hypothetical protein VMK53_04135 [Gemmatimonadales bacterium]|nr:hypothetical protein [Gemmatimonadales bacterium]
MPEGTAYGDHSSHHEGMRLPFRSFPWPVTGWVRGFRLALTDKAGQPLSRQLIHHIAMVNLERRALLQDIAERILAAGQETENVRLPGSLGLPLTAGTEVGVMAAWANETGAAIEGAYLTVSISWSPANRSVRPVDILPLYLDVHYQGVGQTNSYDLPPGVSSRSREFTLPAGGRLLAAGGHLHLHGKELVLEDLETRRTVLRLKAKVNRNGQLEEVERKLFGVRGDGLRLHAGRRYRLTATYDNPTGETIPNGAMGIMAGLFAPSDLTRLPALDRENPGIRADLTALRASAAYGGPGGGH